jgi:hypothetical protein
MVAIPAWLLGIVSVAPVELPELQAVQESVQVMAVRLLA